MASTSKTPHPRPPPADPQTGRGFVSPLGGACQPLRYNLQSKEEARYRAQSRRPADLIPPGPRGREPQR
jgi:hypothetical protein